MTKLAIYRDNTAYSQFLAPVLATRIDFKTQVFAVSTPEIDITSWIEENADYIRGMEEVYMDTTCYEAGESVPSKTQPENKNRSIWRDIKTNYGGIGQNFKDAAQKAVTCETNRKTIAKIIQLMLDKETPTKIYIVPERMEDHDLFGHGHPENKEDAKRLMRLLNEVTGLPINFMCFDQRSQLDYNDFSDSDNVWVFMDRHFKGSNRFDHARIPEEFKQFEVPIENLIGDALELGIELDSVTYAKAVSDIVANW